MFSPLSKENATSFIAPSLGLVSIAVLFFNVTQVKPSSSSLGMGLVNKLNMIITATVTRNRMIPVMELWEWEKSSSKERFWQPRKLQPGSESSAYDVTSAMLMYWNKRILSIFFWKVHQHFAKFFVVLVPGDWLKYIRPSTESLISNAIATGMKL